MTRHLRRAIAPALLSAALVLSACGGSGDGGSSTTPPASGSTTGETSTGAETSVAAGTELPTVAGEFGQAPVFTWPATGAPAGLQVEVLSEGDGPEVTEGQWVLANYAGYVWGSEKEFDSSFSRGEPSGFSLNGVVAGWTQGIPGHKAGSRLLLSIPSELGYPDGNSGAGIKKGDTIVFVVDVLGAYDDAALGQQDAAVVDAPDLPVTIDGAPGEKFTLSLKDGAPEPAAPKVTVVATGTGPALEVGQTAVVNYTGMDWTGTAPQSSTMPEAVPVAEGSSFAGLAGVPVGSRVVLELPKTQTGSAVVFVMDVLGAA